jgi:peroxiredoxin
VCRAAPPDDNSPIEARIYPVAPLVVRIPMENLSTVPTDQQVPDAPKNHFEPLIRHLKKITGTPNWTPGKGEIEESAGTLSLVIRQTPAIHDRIVDELKNLRREQDLQLTQSVTIVTGPRREIAKLADAFPGELGRFEQQELQQKLQSSVTLTTVLRPKITTFNRQVGTLKFGSKVLLTHATVADDRRAIQLKISCAPENQLTGLVSSCQTLTIHDGRTVVVRFERACAAGMIPPDDDAEECLVIVQPRIIIQQQEEEAPQVATLKPGHEEARKQFEALKDEFAAAHAASREAYRNAETDQEREAASKMIPNRADYVRQIFQIVDDHPNEPIAIDALIWVASEDMYWAGGELALKTLAEKHAGNPQVAEYASNYCRYGGPFIPYENLLRAAHQHSHKRSDHAAISLTLAVYLKMLKEDYDQSVMFMACDRRGLIGREEGLENLKRWTEVGVDKLTTEAEQLFKTIIVDYGDVKLNADNPHKSMVEVASQQLYELRNLQIGSHAPLFEANDIHENPINLNDLRGKIVVLDFGSHSGCGICSAIYPELRGLVEHFKDQPFEFIGINQGDEPEELKELARLQKVTWKIIDDGNEWGGPISSKFAINSMPTFYVIDHKGIIRGKGYFGLFEAMPNLIEKLLAERKVDTAARK